MGVFARELFEARGIHGEISVLSYAGSIPPVSCLNDGIQISTGATVGHGLICISDDPDKRVEADFTCGGKTIRVRLKEQYAARIRQDIEKGVGLYGKSPRYWKYVRKLALRYWSNWDRKAIFSVK